jgi:glycosyltransferase involved in cell wall biosynthesis
MTKNILLISDHGDPLAELGGEQAGGQNNYVLQLSLALEKIGHTVDVVTHWSNPSSPQYESFSENCRVIRISAGRKRYLSKNAMYELLPAFYEEMTSLLAIGSYDLIHTHYWLSGLLGERLQREYQVPFVHTSHSLAKAKEIGGSLLAQPRPSLRPPSTKRTSFIVSNRNAPRFASYRVVSATSSDP